ncbi:hypothetical protein FXB41_11370 [Bradyrhizobium canariense]|uniref:hypothetical protein n=1 Tax=Bradyrhizobium canariense TaxID=255045 RepID=UPI001CA5C1B7|nr:hypothetical protein [Bradyrhizobium canariense]MBW5435357.1 hypothetical protein [Bradyrhizobium canariense]
MIAQDQCANFTETENAALPEEVGCLLRFAWHGPIAEALPIEVKNREAGVLYRDGWRSVIVPEVERGLEYLDATLLSGHEYERTNLQRLLRKDPSQLAKTTLEKYKGRHVPVHWDT